MPVDIPIGDIMLSIVKKSGLTYEQVGKIISRSKKTVPNYAGKTSVPIDLLVDFCGGFNIDLLKLYYEIEPMKSLRDDEVTRLNSELQKKDERIKQLEKELKLTQEANEAHKGQLSLLFEQMEEYKTGNKSNPDPAGNV